MNGNYQKTIRLLNIIQLCGWIGLLVFLFVGWRAYSEAGFVVDASATGESIVGSLLLMAVAHLGGILIDIARNSSPK